MTKEKTSDIQVELENRFLTYALSTIVSRSLPDVRDGLKPIHRRILFAMNSLGLSGVSKHVKSAKIIGEVLGKYHPHGDASTYEAMTRMAQDFSMRYPLVDGKGNFGSVDGDAPAAYRYTEGKMNLIASYLLSDIKKDTIDFKTNYDNTLEEPVVLPARIPNLLVNGSSGIAVGMACSFPSHNLTEVISALIALIESPDLTVAQLMKYIKGPDFPTGGIILTPKTEIRKAYSDGQGSVKIRGEWTVEELPRNKRQIIITSLPYGVNKARLIEKIADIIISKKLTSLSDVRDESDEKIRVVLEIKNGTDPEKIVTYLFKHTEWETNFQLNFNCLKPNGEPGRLSLLEICRYFLDFRTQVVTRKLKFDLEIIEKRLHILAGFVAIFKNLDKALKLIRGSKSRQEAHQKLKKNFKLDDEQTSAILEIPLYRLVSMEIGKIVDEQKEKTQEKNRIQSILRSKSKIWGEVKKELSEIEKAFGDKRRTKIKTLESVEYNAEDFIEHEDVFLILSKNGWLRKFKSVTDPAGLKFKENDSLLGTVKANTKELVAIFTSFGMVYVCKAFSLPYTRGGFGDPVQSLFNFGDGERVIHLLSLDPQELAQMYPSESANKKPAKKTKGIGNQLTLLFPGGDHEREGIVASDSGYGFRFPIANLAETTKSGRKIITLKEGERMVGFAPVLKPFLFMATRSGKGMVTELEQVSKLTGTGRGAKLMNVDQSKLAAIKTVDRKDTATLVFEDGGRKEIEMKKVPVYNRGGKGVNISRKKKIINII